MEHNSTLPHHLIVEILLRLPVRSLLRFKCVCKSWLSLISDPQFAKSHFDLVASPTHRILLSFTSGHKIKSMDYEASFKDNSAIVNLNFPSAPRSCIKSLKALGSCRGLVLLASSQVDLTVWNPSTGVHKRIPYFYYEPYPVLYGIGHDSSTDDYLVVSTRLMRTETRLEYFSLKTHAWSDVQCIDIQYQNIGYGFRAGLLLNGAIHWLVYSNHTKLHVIIAFDLMERSLSEIPLSHDLATKLRYERHYLREMRGCLGLCYSRKDRRAMTEIWVHYKK